MSRFFFINDQGLQVGPIDKEYLVKMQISRSTLVWKEGTSGWIHAELEPELNDYFNPAPKPQTQPNYNPWSQSTSPIPPTPVPAPAPATVHPTFSQPAPDSATQSAPIAPPAQSATPNAVDSASAVIDFEYPGYWAATDWKLILFVNDQMHHHFSFKNPDKASIQVPPGTINLRVKFSFRSAKLSVTVEPGKRYQVFLTYNRFWGSISLHLRENQ